MLPIIDYGGIAIVVPKVAAVGKVVRAGGDYGFNVFCDGLAKPFRVMFQEKKEAEDGRDEMIAVIARYYYTREFGPDFDVDDLEEMLGDEGVDEDDGEEGEKH